MKLLFEFIFIIKCLAQINIFIYKINFTFSSCKRYYVGYTYILKSSAWIVLIKLFS